MISNFSEVKIIFEGTGVRKKEWSVNWSEPEQSQGVDVIVNNNLPIT